MKSQTRLIFLPFMAALILTMVYCQKEVKHATLSTSPVTDVTTSNARSGGNITSDGGGEITSRGIVWSTSSNPTVDQNTGLTMDGSGPGIFESEITGLQPNIRYFLRAYAANQAGMVYGDEQQFVTEVAALELTTSPVTGITQNSAVSGGNITSDGGGDITSRGVVWSTSLNPTLEENSGLTTNGSGPGIFESEITGLQPNSVFIVRAYASNEAGTVYGYEQHFETKPPPPEIPQLTTAPVTRITHNFAISGGNITSNGGEQPTVWGVVWGTLPEPTLNTNQGYTSKDYYVNPFTDWITHLNPETKYYIRAYATNSAGTGYGQQEIFTTEEYTSGVGVTDIDGNYYPSVKIGYQEWMTENLRVTRDPNGNDITRYCFDNDPTNCDLYGGLYTWNTMMNGAASSNSDPGDVQGICPTGWHLPSERDWEILKAFLITYGFPDDNVINGAGNALKSCRQVSSPLGGACDTAEHPRWDAHSTHYGIDEFGFSALPGGSRNADGTYSRIGSAAYWWAATELDHTGGLHRFVSNSAGNLFDITYHGFSYKNEGLSVRCLRDE